MSDLQDKITRYENLQNLLFVNQNKAKAIGILFTTNLGTTLSVQNSLEAINEHPRFNYPDEKEKQKEWQKIMEKEIRIWKKLKKIRRKNINYINKPGE